MARIDAIFKLVKQHGASDLHLTTGSPPMVGINAEIVPIPYEELSPDLVQVLLFELMDRELRERFERNQDVDFSYEVPGALRLRCNIYQQAQGVAGAFRLLPSQILSLEQLGVLAQRLLRRADGKGRMLAVEILIANTAVASLIRERKTFQLASVMQTGRREGVQSMDDAVLALVRAGVADPDDAVHHLTSRELLAGAARSGTGAAREAA